MECIGRGYCAVKDPLPNTLKGSTDRSSFLSDCMTLFIGHRESKFHVFIQVLRMMALL